MSKYLVTHEDIEDGTWFDEPCMFDSEDQAKCWVKSQTDAAIGTCRALYRCDLVVMLNKGGEPI